MIEDTPYEIKGILINIDKRTLGKTTKGPKDPMATKLKPFIVSSGNLIIIDELIAAFS